MDTGAENRKANLPPPPPCQVRRATRSKSVADGTGLQDNIREKRPMLEQGEGPQPKRLLVGRTVAGDNPGPSTNHLSRKDIQMERARLLQSLLEVQKELLNMPESPKGDSRSHRHAPSVTSHRRATTSHRRATGGARQNGGPRPSVEQPRIEMPPSIHISIDPSVDLRERLVHRRGQDVESGSRRQQEDERNRRRSPVRSARSQSHRERRGREATPPRSERQKVHSRRKPHHEESQRSNNVSYQRREWLNLKKRLEKMVADRKEDEEKGEQNYNILPPLSRELLELMPPVGFELPSLDKYSGDTNALDHMHHIEATMSLVCSEDHVLCKSLISTLTGAASTWFHGLTAGYITLWKYMRKKFLDRFSLRQSETRF